MKFVLFEKNLFDWSKLRMNSLQSVTSLIFALYGSNDKSADASLRTFQDTQEAWLIGLQLLQQPQVQVQFFGATVIYNKVRFQFETLGTQENKLSLLASLLNCFNVFARNDQFPSIVLKQLVCAFAATVVRVSAQHASGVIGNILTTDIPNKLFILELLIALNDELDKCAITYTKRKEMQSAIAKFSIPVFDLCENFILNQNDPTKQSKAFQCLHKWIENGAVMSSIISPRASGRSILDLMLSGLFQNNQDIFLACVDSLCDLFQKPMEFKTAAELLKSKESLSDNPQVFLLIVQKIMSLRQSFGEAAKSGNDAYCMGICRVVLSLVESHFETILQNISNMETLFQFLLEITSHSNKKIAEQSLDFWIRFEQSITNSGLQASFVGLFSVVLEVLVRQTSLPVNYQSMNEMDAESWKSYRNHAHYCLEHCVSILKARYFQLLAQWVPKQQGQEMQFETILYCLRINVDYSSVCTDDSLLKIVQDFLQSPRSAATFRSFPSVAQTGLLLMGDLADWFLKSPQVQNLPAVLNFITSSLFLSDNDLVYCACKALHKICNGAAKLIASSNGSESILTSCTKALSIIQNTAMKKLILESVLFILLQNSTQTISKFLPMLMNQNLNTLSSFVNNNNTNEQILQAELDILSDVLKVLLDNGSSELKSTEILPNQEIKTVLDALFSKFGTKQEIMEKLCSVYEKLLRLQSKQMFPYLGSTIQVFATSFDRTLNSEYLLIVESAINAFCNVEMSIHQNQQQIQQQNLEQLNQMKIFIKQSIRAISEKVFSVQNPNPALCVEYLKLTTFLFQNSNGSLVSEEHLERAFGLSLQCLNILDPTLLKSVLLFLDFFLFSLPLNPSLKLFVDNSVLKHGALFVHTYLLSLRQNVQRKVLTNSDVFQKFANVYSSQFQQGLQLSLSQPIWNDLEDFGQNERNNFVGGLLKVMQQRLRFKALIKDFAEFVNRNQTPDVFLGYSL